MATSSKQDKSFCEATHRFNLWVGAVRSGKTYASLERFIADLRDGPKGDAMIIGVNRSSLQRNIIRPLFNRMGFSCPTEKAQMTTVYGRTLWFVGAPDISAVSTIQGSTLALAYVDEATNIPEAFWKMLESRLSVPGAKLIATCNPEGPAHFIKKDFIDNPKLDLVHWNFTLEDNPSLDQAFKEQLKASYTGLWYNRYILGQWALSHGAIYDTFDHYNEYDVPNSNPLYYVVGIDYGTTNATAAVLCAVNPNAWPQIRVEAEYYWDAAKRGRSKTDEELVRDLKEFISNRNVSAVYIDPAAASLKVAMRHADIPVLDAKNDVVPGIKTVGKFIAGKNLVIHRSCTTLREQIQSYSWCGKAAARGEDKPDKTKSADHTCLTGDTLVSIDVDGQDVCHIKWLFGSSCQVKAYDGEKFITSISSDAVKTRKDANIVKLTLKNGKSIRATPDHKVCTKRGYIEIQCLLADDEVLCYDGFAGHYSGVESIVDDGIEDVYCIKVPIYGNFVANGIVVKNCDALRYAVYSAFPQGIFSHPDENISYDQLRRNVFGTDEGWGAMIHGGGGVGGF